VAKPRIAIGTFGAIAFLERGTHVEARTRYRDWDGTLRQVQASASNRTAAERALKAKLTERTLFQPGYSTLTPDSGFGELVDYWLADLDLEGRLAVSTRRLYERNMTTLVMPAFKNLVLREIGVARCDFFIKQLAAQSPSRAKQARVVLRLALGLAVRHEILPRNPMDNISRIRRPQAEPTALNPVEVNAVRAAIAYWEQGLATSGPRPDGQLGQIVEVMLGTSGRIGEVLALRRCDVDVTGAPPWARIAGTIVIDKDGTSIRQDHPKSAKSRRTVALPSFTAEAIRGRLVVLGRSDDPEALLFCSRNGTALTTNNIRRQLRKALALAGIEGVSPHMFRRTAATAINDKLGIDLASELLGHTDPRITLQHYIRRKEMVDKTTAEVLEETFAKD